MRIERGFDVAPARLAELERSDDFLAAKLARFGGTGSPSVVNAADGSFVVRLPRRLPLDSVPSFLRRFVGTGDVVQVDSWRAAGDGYEAATALEGGPKQLRLSGRRRVTPNGAGSTYAVELDVTVKLPVGGGQAEKVVTDALTKLVNAELEFTADWLADHC